METTDTTEDDLQSLLDVLSSKPGTSRDVVNDCTDYFDEVDDFVEREMIKMKMGLSQFGKIGDDDDYFSIINYNEDEDELQLPDFESSELSGDRGRKPKLGKEQKIRSLKKALELNTKLQHMLHTFESELALKLESVKEKLAHVQKVNTGATAGESQQDMIKKGAYMKLRIPYFKDGKNFPCPPNEDYVEKLKNDALILIDLPRIKFWKRKDILELESAVKECIITELKNRIESKKSVLDSKVDKGDDNLNVYYEEIRALQNNLHVCKKKSVQELLKNYPPDREFDWLRISAMCFGGDHSETECEKFWHLYAKPSINKGRWSKSEDKTLIELAKHYGEQNWELIARELNTSRSQYQCFIHYQTRLNYKSTLKSGPFSKEEDEKILFLVKTCRKGDYIPWVKIAHHVRTRTPPQIRNRYIYALNPNFVKGRFTENEDLFIVSGRLAYGFGFSKLAQLLQNRSGAQVRERFYRATGVLKTKIGSWTLEEDKRLIELVKIYGEKNWSKISKHIRTRTRTQIRQHYNVIRNKNFDIYKVKRHNAKHRKNLEIKTKTLNTSDQIKEILDTVPGGFELTDVERRQIIGENLHYLLHKNMRKNKKKSISQSQLAVDSGLLEFFMESSPGVCVKKRNLEPEFDSLVKQVHAVCDYFLVNMSGEAVRDKIMNSTHMDDLLKGVLLKVTEKKEKSRAMSLDAAKLKGNIDYIPNQDLCIMFHETWLSERNIAFVDNFSELLKAPLMEYSPGLHKDILENIMQQNRVVIHGNRIETVSECDKKLTTIPFVLPPTYVSETSTRTLMLSRRKFEKAICHHRQLFDPDCFVDHFAEDDIYRKNVLRKSYTLSSVMNMPATQMFEERLLTLYHWPTVAALCTPPHFERFVKYWRAGEIDMTRCEPVTNNKHTKECTNEHSNERTNDQVVEHTNEEVLQPRRAHKRAPGFSFLWKYKKRRKVQKNGHVSSEEENNETGGDASAESEVVLR